MRERQERALRWLAALHDPATALCWSWRGSGAYRYEEATAWVALLAASLPAEQVPDALSRAVEKGIDALEAATLARGGLGRGGRVYLFDTAVAWAAAQAMPGHEALQQRLEARVRAMMAARQAVEGGPRLGQEDSQTPWSKAWGAHLMWLAIPLLRAGQRAQAEALIAELWSLTVRPDGLVTVHGGSSQVYAHAAAYAAEGLSALGQPERAQGILSALLAAPSQSGLVPAHPLSPGGPERTDATAQVLRLAQRGPPPASTARLNSAHAALDAARNDTGGLRYADRSTHLTSWSTVFDLALRCCPEAW